MKVWDKKTKGIVKRTPSPIGSITVVKSDGSKYKCPANRAERRRLRNDSKEGMKDEKEVLAEVNNIYT